MPTLEELQEQLERERAYSKMLELHIEHQVEARVEERINEERRKSFQDGFQEGSRSTSPYDPYKGLDRSDAQKVRKIEDCIRERLPSLIREYVSDPTKYFIPDEINSPIQYREIMDAARFGEKVLEVDIPAISLRIRMNEEVYTQIRHLSESEYK